MDSPHFDGGLEQDPLKISFDLMGLRTVDWCEAGSNVHQTGLVWKGFLSCVHQRQYLLSLSGCRHRLLTVHSAIIVNC